MVEQVDRTLEPCPFCGWAGVEIVTEGGLSFARCQDCEASTGKTDTGPIAAAARWNTRHRTASTAALTTEREGLAARVAELEAENERIWRDRNIAYAKVTAWEAAVYVEGLPLRAVRVDEWGPGEGEQTTVPDVTRKRLVDLLDRLAMLERKALNDPT